MRKSKLKFLGISLALLVQLCLFTSCTGKGGGSSAPSLPFPRPEGNGSGIGGNNPPPTGEFIQITFANARARCNFSAKTPNSVDAFQVQCRALAALPNGGEALTNKIQEGVTLNWLEPKLVSGSPISSSRCEQREKGLTQSCDITLANSEGARVSMALNISDTVQGTRTESDIVYLSFTVTTFGITFQALSYGTLAPIKASTPAAPLVLLNSRSALASVTSVTTPLASDLTTEENLQSFKALQNPSKDPFAFGLGSTPSFCFIKSKLYFIQGNYIYQLDDAGVTLFAGSPNANNGYDFSHPTRLRFVGLRSVACSIDSVYVNDGGKILKISLDGKIEIAYGGTTEDLKLESLALGPDGNLYGSDSGKNAIKKFDFVNHKTTTYVGMGITGMSTAMFHGDGGPADKAMITSPGGMAFGPDGTLYFADVGNFRIRKVNPAGIISTFAGTGANGYAGDGGLALDAKLGSLGALAMGSDGSLYLKDGTYRIRKIDEKGIITTVVGMDPNSGTLSNVIGKSALQTVINPAAIGISPTGMLYLADGVSKTILALTSDGMLHAVVGGGPARGYVPLGKNAQSVPLSPSSSLLLAPDSSIYVTTGDIPYIPKIDATGMISRLVGQDTRGYSGDGGAAANAQIDSNSAMAWGPDGSLYFIDRGNSRVRKVDPLGVISTLYSTTASPSYRDIANAPQGSVAAIDLIAVGLDNAVYFGSKKYGYIEKLNPPGTFAVLPGMMGKTDVSGKVTRYAGSGMMLAMGDGLAASSNMVGFDPYQLVSGTRNELYILDKRNKNIRVVEPDGIISTLKVDPPLQIPISMAISGDSLFVVNQDSATGIGELRLLRPSTDGVVHKYLSESFFGLGTRKDCGAGLIQGKATAISLEKQLNVSLAQLCAGDILAVAARNRCAEGEKTMSIAISQTFFADVHGSSNLIRIDRPCP